MARFDAADLDVQLKADATHVTEADLATERAIRDDPRGRAPATTASSARSSASPATPRASGSSTRSTAPRTTSRASRCGRRLIALSIDGVPRVGVASQPALGRRWWAATGLGAWTNTPDGGPAAPRASHPSTRSPTPARASRASASGTRPASWMPLVRLSRAVWRDRGYGDTWPYMLLAEGRLEFVAEFGVKEYDIAALVPIITEAGGRFTSFDGNDSIAERSLARHQRHPARRLPRPAARRRHLRSPPR